MTKAAPFTLCGYERAWIHKFMLGAGAPIEENKHGLGNGAEA